jgi:ketosteroid isomerase-like protein
MGREASPGPATRLDARGFADLMERLARAWEDLDSEAALRCFTEDAVYMEPPDMQLFQGWRELGPYFAALRRGTFMRFHQLWFDEDRQTGAGEYSFGTAGWHSADHGVAVIEIRNGLISSWREYQRKGPASFQEFAGRQGKAWQWHGGNYPPPTNALTQSASHA